MTKEKDEVVDAENEYECKFHLGRKRIRQSLKFCLLVVVLTIFGFVMSSFVVLPDQGTSFLGISLLGTILIAVYAILFLAINVMFTWLGNFRCWRAAANESRVNKNDDFIHARKTLCWSFWLPYAGLIIPLIPAIIGFVLLYNGIQEAKKLKWTEFESESEIENERKSSEDEDEEEIPL